MRKKYNTPHRSRVVKTRLSEDEYADFTARLAPYGISQSEFLRQAIRRTTIIPGSRSCKTGVAVLLQQRHVPLCRVRKIFLVLFI